MAETEADTEMEVVVKDEPQTPSHNYSLSWEHINYKVMVKDHFWSDAHEKVLLKDVSGYVPAGNSRKCIKFNLIRKIVSNHGTFRFRKIHVT